MPLVQKVWERYSKKFSRDELDILFKESLIRKPLYHKTQLLKIHWVKQIKSAPITFVMQVNQAKWFGPSQLSYFENILRKKYDLRGVPIKFIVRGKDNE